jgi:hypothetical protein
MFRYELLDNYFLSDLKDLKIHNVPTLVFLNTQDGAACSAYVYVLSGKRFDLPRLREQKDTLLHDTNKLVKLQILEERGHDDVLFLVRYSGPSLQSFLVPKQPHG